MAEHPAHDVDARPVRTADPSAESPADDPSIPAAAAAVTQSPLSSPPSPHSSALRSPSSLPSPPLPPHQLEADGLTAASLALHPHGPLPLLQDTYPSKPPIRAAIFAHAAAVGGFHYVTYRDTDKSLTLTCHKGRQGCSAAVTAEKISGNKKPQVWQVSKVQARHAHVLDEVPKEPRLPNKSRSKARPKRAKKSSPRKKMATLQRKSSEDREHDQAVQEEGDGDADEGDGDEDEDEDDNEAVDPSFQDPGPSTTVSPSPSALLSASASRKRPRPTRNTLPPSRLQELGPVDGDDKEFGPNGRPLRQRKAPTRFIEEHDESPRKRKIFGEGEKSDGAIRMANKRRADREKAAAAAGSSSTPTVRTKMASDLPPASVSAAGVVADVNLAGKCAIMQVDASNYPYMDPQSVHAPSKQTPPPPMTLQEQQQWLANRERAHVAYAVHPSDPQIYQSGYGSAHPVPPEQAQRRMPPSSLTIAVPALANGPLLAPPPSSAHSSRLTPLQSQYPASGQPSPAMGRSWGAPISATMQGQFAQQQQYNHPTYQPPNAHLHHQASGWRERISPPPLAIATARPASTAGGGLADQQRAHWAALHQGHLPQPGASQPVNVYSHPGSGSYQVTPIGTPMGMEMDQATAPQYAHMSHGYVSHSHPSSPYPHMHPSGQGNPRHSSPDQLSKQNVVRRDSAYSSAQSQGPSPMGSPAPHQGDLPRTHHFATSHPPTPTAQNMGRFVHQQSTQPPPQHHQSHPHQLPVPTYNRHMAQPNYYSAVPGSASAHGGHMSHQAYGITSAPHGHMGYSTHDAAAALPSSGMPVHHSQYDVQGHHSSAAGANFMHQHAALMYGGNGSMTSASAAASNGNAAGFQGYAGHSGLSTSTTPHSGHPSPHAHQGHFMPSQSPHHGHGMYPSPPLPSYSHSHSHHQQPQLHPRGQPPVQGNVAPHPSTLPPTATTKTQGGEMVSPTSSSSYEQPSSTNTWAAPTPASGMPSSKQTPLSASSSRHQAAATTHANYASTQAPFHFENERQLNYCVGGGVKVNEGPSSDDAEEFDDDGDDADADNDEGI